jgi:hypothetical protein
MGQSLSRAVIAVSVPLALGVDLRVDRARDSPVGALASCK